MPLSSQEAILNKLQDFSEKYIRCVYHPTKLNNLLKNYTCSLLLDLGASTTRPLFFFINVFTRPNSG